MSGPFCPDCGEQCKPQDKSCPECSFPLELEIVSLGEGYRIESDQQAHFKRVMQLLKRGGLNIRMRPETATGLIWWLFPGTGLALFLLTLLFGHNLVDAIWEPPKTTVALLDLNNLNGTLPTGTPATTVEESGESSFDFLSDAFKVSQEQKQDSIEATLNLEDYVDKQVVNSEQIRKLFKASFLDVQVNTRRRRGTLLSDRGHILVDSQLLVGAFKRETRTINSDRSISEKAVWVVPMANRPQGERYKTTLLVKGDQIGLSLLACKLPLGSSVKIDFDHNFNPREKVWVAKLVGAQFYPEQSAVVGSVNFQEDINVWTLATQLGAGYSGAPVFDIYGSLKGVLLTYNDETVVLPMVTLRERAPLIYKEIN